MLGFAMNGATMTWSSEEQVESGSSGCTDVYS